MDWGFDFSDETSKCCICSKLEHLNPIRAEIFVIKSISHANKFCQVADDEFVFDSFQPDSCVVRDIPPNKLAAVPLDPASYSRVSNLAHDNDHIELKSTLKILKMSWTYITGPLRN